MDNDSLSKDIEKNLLKNKSDIKGILFVLLLCLGAVIYKWDYFFSQETFSEVKVVQQNDLKKEVSLHEK